MKRHMPRTHEVVHKDNQTKFHYPSCNESFFQKSKLIEHLQKKHDVTVNVENKQFAKEGDFEY